MNVRITKAGRPSYWYAGNVGSIYPVFDEQVQAGSGRDYQVINERVYDLNRFIAIEDCEIVGDAPEATNRIENWADVEVVMRGLLPPARILALVTDNWALLLKEEFAWLARVQAARASLEDASEARTTVQDGPGSTESR